MRELKRFIAINKRTGEERTFTVRDEEFLNEIGYSWQGATTAARKKASSHGVWNVRDIDEWRAPEEIGEHRPHPVMAFNGKDFYWCPNIREAAEFLGVSERCIYKNIDKAKPCVKGGLKGLLLRRQKCFGGNSAREEAEQFVREFYDD